MAGIILFFTLSIVFSFLCSIWEAVLLSITPSYVSRMIKEKPVIGKLLNTYKDDIDRPLSAILTLNTIAHTVGAIGVGVEAGKLFGNSVIDFMFFGISYESLIAGLMTLAILILSEIIPKTLGATYWKVLTPFTITSLKFLLILLAPFVWLANWITRIVKKEGNKSVLSRADVAAMADAGLKSGALEQEESSIIHNLLKLKKLTVEDIMTPRSVIQTMDESLSLKEAYSKNKPLIYSRIPVFKEQPDNITGMVLKDDILQNLAEDLHHKKLSDVKIDILFVEENITVFKLMDTLVLKRQHMAMVADKFGSTIGLVTLEDLFETLLGLEIIDESDKVEDLQKLARENWEKRAKAQANKKFK